MAPTIQQVSPTIGAEVRDVDVRKLDDGEWEAIRGAFVDHRLLVI